MALDIRDQAAIAGIGQSEYGRFLPDSQLKLGAKALKAALADAGLQRGDVDGMAVHLGWPLGVDYDRVAETYGLDLRWVSQTWLHGRFARVNTAVLFIALLFFGWLWGVWGLLLGAPLVAIAKVVFDRVESLKPAGELLGR